MDPTTELLTKKKFAFKKYINWMVNKTDYYENPVKEISELAFKEWDNLSLDDKYINCSQFNYILLTASPMNNWINDIKNYEDNSCYLNQDDLKRFPKGNYRSKWYQTGFDENEFCAIGIHGQNIWINPKKELTIIRMSSASDPINIKTEELMFSVFKEIGNALV